MTNLNFCIQRLLEAADLAAAENFRDNVERLLRQLLETRLPDAKQRAALSTWAATELGKLETVPGGGTSKLVSANLLGHTSRKMALFQTVLDVLDDVTPATS
jgi:hypothetical protein